MVSLGNFNFKNLIEDFNHLSIEEVMAFTLWFMGDLGQALAVRPVNDMKMKWLDVNAPGNDGLVSCFKQECCTVSYVLWHTIRTTSPRLRTSHFWFERKTSLTSVRRQVTCIMMGTLFFA